jgi:hypothetical protein
MSSLLGPNVFLSSLSSNTLSQFSSLNVTKFHTHTEQQAKLEFCIFQLLYSWAENGKGKDSGSNGNRQIINARKYFSDNQKKLRRFRGKVYGWPSPPYTLPPTCSLSFWFIILWLILQEAWHKYNCLIVGSGNRLPYIRQRTSVFPKMWRYCFQLLQKSQHHECVSYAKEFTPAINIPVIYTGSGAHSAFYSIGTGFFPGD